MLACGSTLLVLIITSSLKNTSLISASSSSDPPHSPPPPLEGLAPAPDGVVWHRQGTVNLTPSAEWHGAVSKHGALGALVAEPTSGGDHSGAPPSPSPPSTSPYLSCSSLQPSSEQGSLNTLWSPRGSWLPKIVKMPTLHKIAVTHRASGWWLWIKFVDE